jgi:4-amino-4-deoxy-L-arabinose transferase-like glycosyltransferase
VAVLFAGLFPWSGLVLPAIARATPRGTFRDAGLTFVLCWLLLPFVFFTLAGSKLPGYIVPCVPPLALLMGRAAVALSRREAFPGWAGPRAVAVLGLLTASLVALLPVTLFRRGDPAWPLAVLLTVWSVTVAFAVARRIAADPNGALAILRVGAAGLLLLLTRLAPEVLARMESGRDLFRPARGREVLAVGAWRTAWMAGYFYNDGNVREAPLSEAAELARRGPTLVLAGPGERRHLESAPGLTVRPLAEGVRGNALLEIGP